MQRLGNVGMSSGVRSEVNHHENKEISGALKYIELMLAEEDIGEISTSEPDPLALQRIENSFHRVITEKEKPSIDDYRCSGSNNDVRNWVESYGPKSSKEQLDSSFDTPLAENTLSQSSEYHVQFKRGAEEADKFIPSIQISGIGLDMCTNNSCCNNKLPPNSKRKEGDAPKMVGANGGAAMKNLGVDIQEQRGKKQLASDQEEEDNVLSELFEKLFLDTDGSGVDRDKNNTNNNSSVMQARNRPDDIEGNEKEQVDLVKLLLLCAKAMEAGDNVTMELLLREIRKHSSIFGDDRERIAHYFANALEERMAGIGAQVSSFLAVRMPPAAHMLKFYESAISALPTKRIATHITIYHVLNVAQKATTLHIIDLGILYGFQWPLVIKHLSVLPGGPPKLRITGIQFPKPGFHPADIVEQAGQRIAKYCKRYNVPLEFNGIAQTWDRIRLEDLKIGRNEKIVVNSLLRFHRLLDETTGEATSPRNAILNLIRKINPDVFVHTIINGSHNSPVFYSRFRKALYHYSAFFNVLETVFERENQARLMCERELFGGEIMNVVACEGPARIMRQETFQQWQIRHTKAGFRPIPIENELWGTLKKMMEDYHPHFLLDKDGDWVLQGWKGRILTAVACWVPDNNKQP